MPSHNPHISIFLLLDKIRGRAFLPLILYSHHFLLAIARKPKLATATGTITNNGARRIAIPDI